MSKPILCLDFDGVIHSYTSGWKGARNIPDPPTKGAIEFIHAALCGGWDVVIHSSRARHWGGISAMRAWLKKHAGALWWEAPGSLGLEDVRFARWKPSAQITIDDRAITFDGTWPAFSDLRSFKPWNKRRPPTAAELEAILNSEDDKPCEILPDGSVRMLGEIPL